MFASFLCWTEGRCSAALVGFSQCNPQKVELFAGDPRTAQLGTAGHRLVAKSESTRSELSVSPLWLLIYGPQMVVTFQFCLLGT